MQQRLDPKSVWFFFIGFVLRWFLIALFVGMWVLTIIAQLTNQLNDEYPRNMLSWLVMVVPAFVVIAFVWAKLSYHFYRYEVTDHGFRKELGVIWKKDVTIPYDKIQNVDIYRGVVARALGLSDLHVQTAGASAPDTRYNLFRWSAHAEGRLPALSRTVAEQLRDELIRRAKHSQGHGV